MPTTLIKMTARRTSCPLDHVGRHALKEQPIRSRHQSSELTWREARRIAAKALALAAIPAVIHLIAYAITHVIRNTGA